jgi:hypothetical protein
MNTGTDIVVPSFVPSPVRVLVCAVIVALAAGPAAGQQIIRFDDSGRVAASTTQVFSASGPSPRPGRIVSSVPIKNARTWNKVRPPGFSGTYSANGIAASARSGPTMTWRIVPIRRR